MSDNPLVLITGCAGFLGKNLINELAVKGVDVLGVDKSAGDVYENRDIKINNLDILTEEGILAFRRGLDRIKNKDICLVHLMGIPDAQNCEKDKILADDVNVKSVEIAWKLAVDYSMKKVVFPSTALVYGTKYEGLIDEEFPLLPENTYARGKVDAENYLINNSEGSGTASVILRLANIYGPGMNKNTVVNTILEQLGQGYLKLNEYRSVRDYLYVGDAIGAFIKVIFSRCGFKVYNVGSSVGYSVWDLANIIAAGAAKEKIISGIKLSEEEVKNGSRLVLSCDRIKSDLKWSPEFSLESGIRKMINA